MKDPRELIAEVAASRRRLIDAVSDLTTAQAEFRPSPESWSVQEQVEL